MLCLTLYVCSDNVFENYIFIPVQASLAANVFSISGHAENKSKITINKQIF